MTSQPEAPGPETPSDRLLTVPEVAKALNVSEYTVHRWIKAGELPHVRLGAKIVRVPAGALAGFLTSRTREATRTPRLPGRPRKDSRA